MKRKNFFYGGVMALMMAFSMSACSESDDPKPDTGRTDDPTNLDYTAENADAWGNYMYNVGMLLTQTYISIGQKTMMVKVRMQRSSKIRQVEHTAVHWLVFRKW